jgi:hypothetical protein
MPMPVTTVLQKFGNKSSGSRRVSLPGFVCEQHTAN